jgi:hypothetical protein
MRRLFPLVLILILVAGFAGVSVLAQQPVEDFRPVAPGELDQEQIPAARLVFAAYAFVWICFVTYLFVLWQRLRKVEVELGEVRSKLGGRR